MTGGMERFALDLPLWLTQQGHRVTVVGPPQDNTDADRGLPFEVVRRARRHRVVAVLRSADAVHINGNSLRGQILSALGTQRPVITHQSYQAVCATALAWAPGVSCPSDAHHPGPCGGCPRQGVASGISVKLHRLGTHMARVNACVSAYQMGRIQVPRARVIYNPVAERAFQAHAPGPGADGVIAFAGRLVGEKGLDLLLRALARLNGATLEVVGDGPMRGTWEALAADLGLRHRVKFHGSRPFAGVAEVYARASVVCAPSVWHEPFGYVVAEAMAMGRPVVATPHGAFTELLQGGRGFLAKAATPEALAHVLDEALRDSSRCQQRGAAARVFAWANLRMAAVGPQYLDAYHSHV
jgi:glycosyltransferase involved in cell wall biosynthesis